MEPSNILKIETLSNLWCDKDIVILHACFQLLSDCIEKENLLTGHIDWNASQENQKAKKEIEELYCWWLNRKIKLVDKKLDELDKEQYYKDNEMLIRLIKVRQYLWT